MKSRKAATVFAAIGFLVSGPAARAPNATADAAEAAPAPVVFHVSPDGNDAWSGRLEVANAGRTDGPFGTFARAQQAVRAARAEKPPRPITVLLAGGTYHIAAPLVFTPDDSGTADCPVTFAARPGERPVIDGGRVITGWRQEGKLWTVTLPDVAAGKWYFSQLFVDGQRRLRARMPNEGFFRMTGPAPPVRGPDGKETIPNKSAFAFRPGDLRPLEHIEDANLILMHSWENSIHHIKSIDTERNVVELAAPLKEWWTIGYWEREARYRIENVREALDAPGGWFLDRRTGVLSYFPLPGEGPGKAEVVAPVLGALVRIEGRPDEGRMVEHLHFRGLDFKHCDWTLAPEGNSSTQAAVDVPAAITADGARDFRLEDCTVAHTGIYAVWLRRGCKDCRIARCQLYDLGAGGVRLGETQMPADDAALTSGTEVDNNYIHHFGEVYPAGVGVLILQSSDNRVSHNEIHDGYYTGISVGWNWGDGPTRSHGNLIEYNHVHHVVRRLLSDGAGIYTLGTSPGTVLRNNLIHDVFSYERPLLAWGIYLDALSNQILVENNVCHDVQNGGLMFHNGSFENTIRNNVFARSACQLVWRSLPRGGPNVFERNVCYVTQGDLFLPDGNPDLRSTWDHNLYWRTDGEELLPNGLTVEAWREKGLDRHSIIADPQFVDPEGGDFRLKPGSPAITELGFRPTDPRSCGLYGDPAWVALPKRQKFEKTVLPPPPHARRPTPIADGFEKTTAGLQPEGATISGEGNGASIRVTDQRAAAGRQSVRVTDAAGLRHTWEPHFYYQPYFSKGTARAVFQLYLGPDARPLIEWRGGGSTGPSLTVDGQERLLARGRPLVTLPRGQWIRFELTCPLGKEAKGSYGLTVTVGGQPPQRFADLECDANFRILDWFGFVSLHDGPSVFYVDDLALDTVPEPPAGR